MEETTGSLIQRLTLVYVCELLPHEHILFEMYFHVWTLGRDMISLVNIFII